MCYMENHKVNVLLTIVQQPLYIWKTAAHFTKKQLISLEHCAKFLHTTLSSVEKGEQGPAGSPEGAFSSHLWKKYWWIQCLGIIMEV